ncbi:MAG: hypothetical protein JXC33_04300 [Deltaproteobacteria bacterium]|nr:hypothetical protein [Deltaproteobacteria bacterium]
MTTLCRGVMSFLCCAMLVFFLAGCFPKAIYLPEKFSTIEEVYPSDEIFNNLKDVPADSHKRVVFEVPYEDIFRIAQVSATQAMFNVESVDKSKGFIRAMKVTQEPGVWNYNACGSPKNDKRYFYAIKIIETGPTTTEVIIVSKEQGASCYAGGASVGSAVGTAFGLFNKEKAVAYASVHWSTNLRDLLQFFTLIRNNLIAAGLI